MMKRSLALVALLAAVVVGATVAHAGGKKQKVKVTDTAQTRTLMPGPGGNGVISTGTIEDKKYGTGALIVTIESAAPGTTTSDYTATVFYKRGSVSGKGAATATPQSDGSISYTGTFTITRGTGAFKGAKGKATLTGSSPANDTQFTTLTLTGTVIP